jgi:hypothetical protein
MVRYCDFLTSHFSIFQNFEWLNQPLGVCQSRQQTSHKVVLLMNLRYWQKHWMKYWGRWHGEGITASQTEALSSIRSSPLSPGAN